MKIQDNSINFLKILDIKKHLKMNGNFLEKKIRDVEQNFKTFPGQLKKYGTIPENSEQMTIIHMD